jgi:hypothetical protein
MSRAKILMRVLVQEEADGDDGSESLRSAAENYSRE